MTGADLKVVTVAQMQALEAASERAGVSTDTLMENAGLACARFVRNRTDGSAGRRILLLIGPGNNGADGLVIARILQQWGADTLCYVVRGRPDYDPKMALATSRGVAVAYADDDPDYNLLTAWLARSDVIIDAILGAGRYRPLSGVTAAVTERVNARRRPGQPQPVIAIDLPTGVNPDTGAADPNTIAADVTLALGCPKFGIAGFPGARFAGRIETLDIGLPPAVVAEASLPVQWLDGPAAAALLPPRPPDAHKGTFGHLLIIAGSRNFVGAAALAAAAAHRVGAGLVTLASPRSIYPMLASRLTETIHLPLPEDAAGRIHPSAAPLLIQRMPGYSACAVGCGLGRSDGTAAFIAGLLLSAQSGDSPASDGRAGLPPVIIDADGLNSLAASPDWPGRLRAPAVLTPHPGEMTTLTGLSTPDIQSRRLDVGARFARQWAQTVLLKGAHTIISAPDGRQRVLPCANPALAAGGSGDVLTGIIGGLLAQGVAPYAAASLGAFLHAAAADVVRGELGSAGAAPSDLLPRLPLAIRQLREQNAGGPG